jgi:hypothetical protein
VELGNALISIGVVGVGCGMMPVAHIQERIVEGPQAWDAA